MKIKSININRWRNFRNIDFLIPEDAKLICLIAENGLGKTSFLNLIGAAADKIGIAQGYTSSRPNPLTEEHDLEIVFSINKPFAEIINPDTLTNRVFQQRLAGFNWDNTLTLTSSKGPNSQATTQTVRANGMGSDDQKIFWGQQISGYLKNIQDLHYLLVDSDRSFPKQTISDNEILGAERTDFEDFAQKKNFAYQSTDAQYKNWLKFMVGKERKYASEFAKLVRKAALDGREQPVFEDQFIEYNNLIQSLLPQLSFCGSDQGGQQINFSNSHCEIPFHNLSGGEKEICYIVGQIFRYKLQNGLLLLDEPELHLNPDLVRKWISFLRNSINEGQIWIATHAIEATEVAGPEYTFLFNKEPVTGNVSSIRSISESNTITELFSSLGMPAYSLQNKKFVLLEGSGRGDQRQLFYRITNFDTYRFIEGDGCKQVLARKGALDFFSSAENIALNVAAIIDRDFKTTEEIAEITNQSKTFVLEVHEIENFFLYPQMLNLITPTTTTIQNIHTIIKNTASSQAGNWILKYANSKVRIAPPSRDLRIYVNSKNWNWIQQNELTFISELQALLPVDYTLAIDFVDYLRAGLAAFRNVVDRDDLWKSCMGKETLRSVPRDLGFANVQVIIDHAIDKWTNNPEVIPAELTNLKEFLGNL